MASNMNIRTGFSLSDKSKRTVVPLMKALQTKVSQKQKAKMFLDYLHFSGWRMWDHSLHWFWLTRDPSLVLELEKWIHQQVISENERLARFSTYSKNICSHFYLPISIVNHVRRFLDISLLVADVDSILLLVTACYNGWQ